MIGEIAPYNSMGREEHVVLDDLGFMAGIRDFAPLSGYLAGKERGGEQVCALEDAWCNTFGVRHAIACNSATSGLLAASFVIGLRAGDTFVCPAMTMSATAAAPMFTGATPLFQDVRDTDFGLQLNVMPDNIKAIFTTNLFGHPSILACNEWHLGKDPIFLIEDNAQSPFAMTHNGRYAGTNGTIGVWSLNVHKHIQCGEGGMITTDINWIALALREFINHGENGQTRRIGLNLRMPELCAAVALSQLRRGKELVANRVAQAEAIIAAIGEIPGIRPPVVQHGCTSVHYTIPFLVENRRDEIVAALRSEGVPLMNGYVAPLYRLPAFSPFARPCPIAESLHDRRLFLFENCAYSPTDRQIHQIGAAFQRVFETIRP